MDSAEFWLDVYTARVNLVQWAVEQLEAGQDTPDLCILAGLGRYETSEQFRHFHAAARALEMAPPGGWDDDPDRQMARIRWHYGRMLCDRYVNGSLGSGELVRQMYQEVYRKLKEDWPQAKLLEGWLRLDDHMHPELICFFSDLEDTERLVRLLALEMLMLPADLW